MGREINLDFYFDIMGNSVQYGGVPLAFLYQKSGNERNSDIINGAAESVT